MRLHHVKLAIVVCCITAATGALAASPDDYKAAVAKAEAAMKAAHAARNEWTTTANEMKNAKKAADAGNFDEAVKHAQEAEALAEVSLEQAKEQKKVWPQAVVR